MRRRRILSLWFPRLASERVLRHTSCPGPFAIVVRAGRGDQLSCLTDASEAVGLRRGMTLADARALCPGLVTRIADPVRDVAFLALLARWAGRWSPLTGIETAAAGQAGAGAGLMADGLVLDVTGVAHLFGGEAAMIEDVAARAARAGLTLYSGLADTRGAAWALARFGAKNGSGAVAAPGAPLAALGPLPPAALRLETDRVAALERIGLRRVHDLVALPRAVLARRFGADVVARLDQALGAVPEPVSPLSTPPHFTVRLTLPEPIGLVSDLRAGLDRLLPRMAERLKEAGQGARRLRLEMRRVDGSDTAAEIGLARPMHDARTIAALFAPALETVEAGFGIDRLRLIAQVTEPIPARQLAVATSVAKAGATAADQGVARAVAIAGAMDSTMAPGAHAPTGMDADRLADLVTRLGNRLGFENLRRIAPAESHIPERGFIVLPAAWPQAAGRDVLAATGPDIAHRWLTCPARPLVLFAPEPVTAAGSTPPPHFRWRRMNFSTRVAAGPERIAPEWWFDDPAWRSGIRDYWRVDTAQGRRLWMFHCPQAPGWAVQGEFA